MERLGEAHLFSIWSPLMASNVLSPDQGGWKFWAGCGSSEPRLQPPGKERPFLAGSSGFSWVPSAAGPPLPVPGHSGHQDTLFACWPEQLRLRPRFFGFFFFLLFFSLYSPFSLFLSVVCCAFSSSSPLSRSHFPFHYPRSPFHLHFSFSLLLSSVPALPSRCSSGLQGVPAPLPPPALPAPSRCHVPERSRPPSGARSGAAPAV